MKITVVNNAVEEVPEVAKSYKEEYSDVDEDVNSDDADEEEYDDGYLTSLLLQEENATIKQYRIRQRKQTSICRHRVSKENNYQDGTIHINVDDTKMNPTSEKL